MSEYGAGDTGRPHLYHQVGIASQVTGDTTAEGTMPVHEGILTSGGIRAAILGLLIEGSFGNNLIGAGLFPVLDNMTMHIRDGGADVRAVRSHGDIVRGTRRATALWAGDGCGRSFQAPRIRHHRLLHDSPEGRVHARR